MFYKFHARHVPPPGVNREPKPPTKKFSLQLKNDLEREFREELSKPILPLKVLILDIESETRQVRFERTGRTTMVARWLRGSTLATEAMTILLSGVDVNDDEQALGVLERDLTGKDRSMAPLAEQFVAMIREQARPLAITIHYDAQAYDDPAIRVCAGGIGAAFFGLIGVEAD